jgi:Flp pilus assembly CpaF family ATPase
VGEENTEHFAIRNLTVAIKNIARACGDEISERQPMLDARLEDGSRVAAMFPPCAVDDRRSPSGNSRTVTRWTISSASGG